jgi:hypothetical protein
VRSFERLVVGPGYAAEPGPTAAREWFIHAVDQPDPASGYDVSVDVRGPTPGCGVVTRGKRERFGRRNGKLPLKGGIKRHFKSRPAVRYSAAILATTKKRAQERSMPLPPGFAQDSPPVTGPEGWQAA